MFCHKILICNYALAGSVPGETPPEVFTFIQAVTREIINPIIGILFAAALLYFFWGLLMFIFRADDTSKRDEYKQHMLWGLIGLTVMVSAYAILAVGLRTLGVTQTHLPDEIPLNI